MEHQYNGIAFYFRDGDAIVEYEGVEICTRYIGFNTSLNEFEKWCEYFAEFEFQQALADHYKQEV